MPNELLFESMGKKVQVLWAAPAHRRNLPLIVCVHGHMENRCGAALHVNFMSLQRRLSRWGACIASVSQPGYGKSEGPADYCGPLTQQAVIKAIEHLTTDSRIDPKRVAIIGYSRGAIVAAMVATKLPHLSALVLGSGFYDFKQYYRDASSSIRAAIEKETELVHGTFEARSALLFADQIRSPLLIFHGRKDERGGLNEARLLAEKVRIQGVQVVGHFYDDLGHFIPIREFLRETFRFLKVHLNEAKDSPTSPSVLRIAPPTQDSKMQNCGDGEGPTR